MHARRNLTGGPFLPSGPSGMEAPPRPAGIVEAQKREHPGIHQHVALAACVGKVFDFPTPASGMRDLQVDLLGRPANAADLAHPAGASLHKSGDAPRDVAPASATTVRGTAAPRRERQQPGIVACEPFLHQPSESSAFRDPARFSSRHQQPRAAKPIAGLEGHLEAQSDGRRPLPRILDPLFRFAPEQRRRHVRRLRNPGCTFRRTQLERGLHEHASGGTRTFRGNLGRPDGAAEFRRAQERAPQRKQTPDLPRAVAHFDGPGLDRRVARAHVGAALLDGGQGQRGIRLVPRDCTQRLARRVFRLGSGEHIAESPVG